MAVSYPDLIGEYVAKPERYFTNGVQFAGYFQPAQIGLGQGAHFYLFLQNTLNVPVAVELNIGVPKSGGFLRSGKEVLAVGASKITAPLDSAAVGMLTLPVTLTEHAKEGEYALTVEVKASPEGRGERIRPSKSTSQLETTFIDNLAGLDLVGSLGANYSEKSAKKADFEFEVTAEGTPLEESPDLKPSLSSVWTIQEGQYFHQAIQEINNRQVKLKTELSPEALFVNLYAESTVKFADAGVPLRVGEAIILGKILTYSCQYFLSHPKRSYGLLAPIWEQALQMGIDTTEAIEVVRQVGYHHILRLSVAMSFGILAQTFRRHFWSLEERQGVTNYIADSVEMGNPLDLEFLYLPLLMAGSQISSKVRLEGEDPAQTLALIKKARAARKELFADEDMAQANKIYNQILSKAAA
jgi:hypothetical protein